MDDSANRITVMMPSITDDGRFHMVVPDGPVVRLTRDQLGRLAKACITALVGSGGEHLKESDAPS